MRPGLLVLRRPLWFRSIGFRRPRSISRLLLPWLFRPRFWRPWLLGSRRRAGLFVSVYIRRPRYIPRLRWRLGSRCRCRRRAILRFTAFRCPLRRRRFWRFNLYLVLRRTLSERFSCRERSAVRNHLPF